MFESQNSTANYLFAVAATNNNDNNNSTSNTQPSIMELSSLATKLSDTLDNITSAPETAETIAHHHHHQHNHYLTNTQDETKHFNDMLEDLLLKTPTSFKVTLSICFALIISYKILIHLVLGKLRISEQQNLREAFWDYSIQKFLFTLMIVDAKNYQERFQWIIWYMIIGSMLLVSRLCKDRFDSCTSNRNWPLVKIAILLITFLTFTLFTIFTVLSRQQVTTQSLFLLTDSVYALTFVISAIWKLVILLRDMKTKTVWENRSTILYYSDLTFAYSLFSIELLHSLHLLLLGLSFPLKLYCLKNLYKTIMDIQKRYRRHSNYRCIVELIESNFPIANQEDIADDCAICWDEMKSARKLPCSHLFHDSCLRSWLEQDTSCPTCRTGLKSQHDISISETESGEEFIETRVRQRNHLFHFDSSRYTNNPALSWLPTISIEGFM